MGEGVVVDAMPVAMNKGGNQQKECALGLMEICYHPLHNLVLIAWGNDDTGGCMQGIQVIAVKVVKDILKVMNGTTFFILHS